MKLQSKISVLSKEEMNKIHEGSLKVLREVGLRIQHPRLCNIMDGYGCKVSGDVVKFPNPVIEGVVEKMRSNESIPHKNLNSANKNEEPLVSCTASGQAINIHDHRASVLRDATQADLINAIQIIKTLPNARISHPPFIPQDVPPMVRDLAAQAVMAQYYPGRNSVDIFSTQTVEYFIEIGIVILGSMEEVRKNPPFGYELPFTAFQISQEDTDILFQLYDRGIECSVGMVMPVIGASTPVTLAGELVVQTAQMLGANAVSDVLFGRVTGYHAGPTLLDMSSTVQSQSAPETSLLYIAGMDLSRYYGNPSPSFNYALSSDSKIPDVQAGLEKGYKGILAALAGSPVLGSGLGVLATAFVSSLPQIIIDYEFCSVVNRMLKGIEVNEETMALDLIMKKGIKGFYLDEPHTVQHFRDELLMTNIFNRDNANKFKIEADDMLKRAVCKVESIIGEEPENLLNIQQQKEIANIMVSAKKKLG